MKRITDKERLDWLEAHECSLERPWRKDGRSHEWLCAPDPAGKYFYGDTPRQAIDAAIREEKRGKK